MKNAIIVVLIVGFVLYAIFVNNDIKIASSDSHESAVQKVTNPMDFFPTTIGKTWHYRIKTGPAEPLGFRTEHWSMFGNQEIVQDTRYRFRGLFDNSNKSEFDLILRLKQRSPTQGQFHWEFGYYIEKIKDELGVFSNEDSLFFLMAPDKPEFFMVSTISPDEIGAPRGSWGMSISSGGYTMRPFFFISRPGMQLSLGEVARDRLLFVGVEQIPGRSEFGLHFTRRVTTKKSTDNNQLTVLDKDFVEEMWFAEGKGLVLLEQYQSGNLAMTWQLIN